MKKIEKNILINCYHRKNEVRLLFTVNFQIIILSVYSGGQYFKYVKYFKMFRYYLFKMI